jgi:class 3 adenylate cyclase
MPMYMDRHELSGVTPEDVAAAHLRDLEVQGKYGVRYLTYWFDDSSGAVFCLAEGPSADAVNSVHRESHGLVANRILEVERGMVRAFLGKISDPDPTHPDVEVAFRAILFTDLEGSTSMTQELGDAAAMAVLRTHDVTVRGLLGDLGGSEVKHTGDGIMASFPSVVRAVECAIGIQRKLADHNETAVTPIRVRVGLSAGEPVTENDDLFGAAVQLAARVCDCALAGGIYCSNAVRELAIGKGFLFEDRGAVPLKGFEGPIQLHEVRWQAS